MEGVILTEERAEEVGASEGSAGEGTSRGGVESEKEGIPASFLLSQCVHALHPRNAPARGRAFDARVGAPNSTIRSKWRAFTHVWALIFATARSQIHDGRLGPPSRR